MNHNYEIIQDILETSIPVLQKPIDSEANLYKLGMDSISFIQIVVALEEKFDMEIPDEYLFPEKLDTIRKMEDMIQKIHLEQQGI